MPSYRMTKSGRNVQVGSPEDNEDDTATYRPPSRVSTQDLAAAAGEKGGESFVEPKMNPGEGLGAFAARRKKARSDYEAKAGQKKALSR